MMKLMRRSAGSSGAALLELAIIGPFILAITLGAFHYARALKSHETMSIISGSAARIAYSSCNPDVVGQVITNQTALNTFATACLPAPFASATRDAALVLPASDLVVSFYTYDTTLHPPGARLVASQGVNNLGRTPHGYSSAFNATIINNSYANVLNANTKYAIVAEVFYQQNVATGSIPWILPLSPRVLYESTIY